MKITDAWEFMLRESRIPRGRNMRRGPRTQGGNVEYALDMKASTAQERDRMVAYSTLKRGQLAPVGFECNLDAVIL